MFPILHSYCYDIIVDSMSLCVCVCVCVHWVLLLKGGREGESGGERDGVELSVLFCASPVIQDDKLAKFRLTFFE